MAYRRQRVAETATAHDRTRVLNERFTATAAQLGDDQAAVRLAGVHAMAGLADDWEENRQTCIDVLCAYLRIPHESDPGGEAATAIRLAFRAGREVRHTVIRVIAAHLRTDAVVSWQGLNFDFTGVVFDGGSFDGAEFSSGTVSFDDANFSGGTFGFRDTKFSGARVSFHDTEFSSGRVIFRGAEFSGGRVTFRGAEFSGGEVGFYDAEFSGGEVSFHRARISAGEVSFAAAQFSAGEVAFRYAVFSGGEVGFDHAVFSGGAVDFAGGRFSGGSVDFSSAADWSHPPKFDWEGTPPSGLKLSASGADESQ
jgi:uncharacterized protein YjbI with pentapeptide repeats